jgi:hypothetical protein
MNLPIPMCRDELLAVLDDIREGVAADDSFEGSVEYLMPGRDDPDCQFMVCASYRTGNSAGQGGLRMVGKFAEGERHER